VINMTLIRAAKLLGCPELEALEHDADSFSGITTDSRKVSKGQLFAALGGEKVDGHDYAESAVHDGAAALLVSKVLDLPVPQLLVKDVLVALGQLAEEWRSEINPAVVGITGSNGKTTTREMVSRILELDAKVLSTCGNYNNELGLPLTLFRLEHDHQFAVLELGASKRGDIRYLSNISSPDIGLITNIGPAHLQGFGDQEGVARAKGELYEALPEGGVAIINADEKWSDLWKENCRANTIITFGRQAGCDVYPEFLNHVVNIVTPMGSFPLRLHLPGEHNLQNALAATAIAVALNIPLTQIQKGLESTQPVPGRLNLLHTEAGWTVLDDTYNANPASLYAALQVLAHQSGESWLVLGDMKELGIGSRKMHAEMGEAAKSLGVRKVFALGEATKAMAESFGAGARHFESHKDLIDVICRELHPGVTCLVKGSRSMKMERVVSAITAPCTLRETG
jgi:UDP-N-acetylmuramoyl-tripeptide--D-alanyl-D-alanine ligase